MMPPETAGPGTPCVTPHGWAVVPARIVIALRVVEMFRGTGWEPPAFDGDRQRQRPLTMAEQAAYVAALEQLRLYLWGEFSGGDGAARAAPPPPPKPDPPPGVPAGSA